MPEGVRFHSGFLQRTCLTVCLALLHAPWVRKTQLTGAQEAVLQLRVKSFRSKRLGAFGVEVRLGALGLTGLRPQRLG